MAHDSISPDSLARAVYRSLQTGTELPVLDNSETLAHALLAFDPIDGHIASSGSDSKNDDDERRALPSIVPECQKRTWRASVLVLEALSRKRLDAVEQLHEVCPELLNSIPLFDNAGSFVNQPSTSQALSNLQPRNLKADRTNVWNCCHPFCPYPMFHIQSTSLTNSSSSVQSPCVSTTHTDLSRPSSLFGEMNDLSRPSSLFGEMNDLSRPSSLFGEMNALECPHKQTSVLLDLAAETRSMLTFVLQNHVAIGRQHDQRGAHRDAAAKGHSSPQPMNTDEGRSVCSPDSTATNRRNSSLRGAPSTNLGRNWEVTSNNGETRLFHEKRDDDKGNDILLLNSDFIDPVNICIDKNNPDVLKYLLYKKVWVTFVPYERINGPYHVTGGSCDDSSQTCAWFLHCAALTGHSRLLHLLLRGQFSHQCAQGALPPYSTNARSTQSTPDMNDETPNRSDSKGQTQTEVGVLSYSGQESNQDYVTNGPYEYVPRYLVSQCPETNATTFCHQKSATTDWSVTSSESTFQTESAVGNESTELEGVASSSHGEQVREISVDTSPGISNVQTPLFYVPRESVSSMTNSQERNTTSMHTIPSTSTPLSGIWDSNTAHSFQQSQDVSSWGHESPATRSRSHSGMPQPQSASLTSPDPNMLLPVYLPVKDHVIPNGTSVRLAPLHLACWRCDPASIQVLLNHGADVNLLTEPLDNPAAFREGNTNSLSSAASSESVLRLIMDSSDSGSSDTLDSLESMVQRMQPQRESCALSPLSMLTLGVRSPPSFSLYPGKCLGLVLPSLPEPETEQRTPVDNQLKGRALKALQLLLEAGCDINAKFLFFGRTVRALEFFLKPSRYLYYSLHAPRTYSPTLHCMDLQRVADIVLSMSWTLLRRGARTGPRFSASMEWNLSHMDWVRIGNGWLKRRFLHLAVFLGLFPPLDPVTVLRSNLDCVGDRHSSSSDSDESPVFARPSSARTDLREIQGSAASLPDDRLQPTTSATPASGSALSRSYSVFSDSEEDREMAQGIQQDGHDEGLPQAAASSHSVDSTQPLLPESRTSVSHLSSTSVIADHMGDIDLNDTTTMSQTRTHILMNSPTDSSHPRTAAIFQESVKFSSCRRLGASLVFFQRQNNRQRRCLTRFLEDVVSLSVSPHCQKLILRFLCLPDLHVLSSIIQAKLRAPSNPRDDFLQDLKESVYRAQFRTLRHHCKLAILWAVRWRPAHIHSLPLPIPEKNYLLSLK